MLLIPPSPPVTTEGVSGLQGPIWSPAMAIATLSPPRGKPALCWRFCLVPRTFPLSPLALQDGPARDGAGRGG